MKTATFYIAGIVAAAISSASAIAAEQDTAGVITGINRLNGTIGIARVQSGTVGANTGGAGEEFKVRDVDMMESVHAGDRVTFSTSETDGVNTITKLDRQK